MASKILLPAPVCVYIIYRPWLRGNSLGDKMASNMPVRELLSPEKVLASLKSSGTFDRFRKSCMASVELEVSYIGRSR